MALSSWARRARSETALAEWFMASAVSAAMWLATSVMLPICFAGRRPVFCLSPRPRPGSPLAGILVKYEYRTLID